MITRTLVLCPRDNVWPDGGEFIFAHEHHAKESRQDQSDRVRVLCQRDHVWPDGCEFIFANEPLAKESRQDQSDRVLERCMEWLCAL